MRTPQYRRLAVERYRHPLAGAKNLAVTGASIAVVALGGLAVYGILAGAAGP